MVTNYPHPIASHDGLRTTGDETHADSLGRRVMNRLHQLFCGLYGHDALMHFEQERMSLRCTSCGHETPGWKLNETPPTVTIRGDTRQKSLVRRPQLIGARRIA